MSPYKLSLTLLLTGLSTINTYAAPSIEMKLTGTIVPESCDISMPSGNVVDYGRIGASELAQNGPTKIDESVRAQLQVTCQAPTNFTLKPIDARAGSALILGSKFPHYGLGLVDGVKVGSYGMEIQHIVIDGQPGMMKRKMSNDTTTTETATYAVPNSFLSFEIPTKPVAPIKHLTADVFLRTYVAQRSSLPLQKEVPLDGLSTFELFYE